MLTFIRSTLFHILFFIVTGIMCLLCLPGLLLPRKQAMGIVWLFVNSVYVLEKYVAGLDYEVRGAEYLPQDGPYIIAAKHQSPYETMKLHHLFGDPAIVLKKELLRVPLWGRFLAKIDPIAIDRASGKQAMTQIIDGAEHIKAQGRPIVIFPQGTRVPVWQRTADKPYKIGVARMRDATHLPVIPMALNTGIFWRKGGWIVRPGKVVFQFLPPVDATLDAAGMMTYLETTLEDTSAALAREALAKHKYPLSLLEPPKPPKA